MGAGARRAVGEARGRARREGGGRAYKGPRAGRGRREPPSRVPPCSASASRRESREPRAALRHGAGLTPERARTPAVGTGGALRTPALGEGAGGSGGAQVPADQPGSWPRRAARAATRPVRHAPAGAPRHRPLAPRRPRDPGRPPGPSGMEPHVLGAVLYWLLLPFALLAGEWGRAWRALDWDRVCVPAPGIPAGPPGENGRAKDGARAGAEIPRDARPWAPAFQKHESAGPAGKAGAPSERQAGRAAAAGWRADGTLAPTKAGGERPPERAAGASARGAGDRDTGTGGGMWALMGGAGVSVSGARISFSLSC